MATEGKLDRRISFSFMILESYIANCSVIAFREALKGDYVSPLTFRRDASLTTMLSPSTRNSNIKAAPHAIKCALE